MANDPMRIALTPAERYGAEYSADAASVLSPEEFDLARQSVRRLSDYRATPLVELPDVAAECGVSAVAIKEEGRRLPTRSFKVLGPPYALARQLLARVEPTAEFQPRMVTDLIEGRLRQSVAGLTAVAATSGNHGRALAWAAGQFGCQCRIYMPDATGAEREAAIKQFGATTIRVAGTFDAAVDRASSDSEQHGYLLIGDGAPPDSNALRHILHGYAVLGDELIEASNSSELPTHVFVPAGSGTLAAAVTARLWMEQDTRRPKVIVVQAHAADSAYQSALCGWRTAASGDLKTVMDGLSVGEISPDAWSVLREGAFAFVTIGEEIAVETLRRFARDGRLAIGETGIAAVAAFLAAAKNEPAREQLGLNSSSRAVLVATEGVTDRAILERLTGGA